MIFCTFTKILNIFKLEILSNAHTTLIKLEILRQGTMSKNFQIKEKYKYS